MAFLELTHVRKEFGRTVAVEDFNLQVERGEFVSFLGPSGCGKTTTLRMVAGFELPTSGHTHIDGKEITYVRPNAQYRHGLSILCTLSQHDSRPQYWLRAQGGRQVEQ
ncbi:MAG: ATP-binding cassette domain-containing protein [Caldilineaceae bacterium]